MVISFIGGGKQNTSIKLPILSQSTDFFYHITGENR